MARKKPCEWCGEDQIYQVVEAQNVSGQVEVYPDNGVIAFWVQGMNDDGELKTEESMDIPMNYCPNCGRKLM